VNVYIDICGCQTTVKSPEKCFNMMKLVLGKAIIYLPLGLIFHAIMQ